MDLKTSSISMGIVPQTQTSHTPYSEMAANKLFFCLHVYLPSLHHFHFKILLVFIHADEAKRANEHAHKRIIYWSPFWNKVYAK